MLSIDTLTCRRGSYVVLRGATVTVPAGGCLLVTGANGSGKSTLLRALAGLVPAGGEIRWNGAAVADDIAAYRDQLHYIGHQDAVKPELTAAEMIGYWRELQDGQEQSDSSPLEGARCEGIELTSICDWTSPVGGWGGVRPAQHCRSDRQVIAKRHASPSNSPLKGGRTKAVLAAREGVTFDFDVEKFLDRPIRSLSTGQKRRLALTRLLLTPRPLWLLDEPATALDAAGQGLLLAALKQHRATGGMAIIATHDDLPIPDAQGLAL